MYGLERTRLDYYGFYVIVHLLMYAAPGGNIRWGLLIYKGVLFCSCACLGFACRGRWLLVVVVIPECFCRGSVVAVAVSCGRHPVMSLYGICRFVREQQRRTTDSRLRLSGMTAEGVVAVIPECLAARRVRGSVVAVSSCLCRLPFAVIP